MLTVATFLHSTRIGSTVSGWVVIHICGWRDERDSEIERQQRDNDKTDLMVMIRSVVASRDRSISTWAVDMSRIALMLQPPRPITRLMVLAGTSSRFDLDTHIPAHGVYFNATMILASSRNYSFNNPNERHKSSLGFTQVIYTPFSIVKQNCCQFCIMSKVLKPWLRGNP